MKSIILLLALVLTLHNVSAQFVIFNDNTLGDNQAQNIRTSAAVVNGNNVDLIPIGQYMVAKQQVTGGTQPGGNQWYLIDYPNGSSSSTQGYVAAGTPLCLPTCNQSYITITNSTGSSNIHISYTLASANVNLNGTPLVGWTGQSFALVSNSYTVYDWKSQ